jgi:uncharacterized protein with HEPN domain
MRNDQERMRDIQESINKIEKYVAHGKEEFFANELIQSWMLLQLQIIGEAARSMNSQTHEQHPEISWRDIIDFRNLLVHETDVPDFQPYPENVAPSLAELAQLSAQDWDIRFRASALRRIRPDMMRRNAKASLPRIPS